ncbi:MAG: glycosyltransferase family 9 protein [Candidatus Omnitrophica bacterium]|nr:glycosyltransferase family 9 protein [Candidatus Omnitrophota bacterium]
MKVLIVRNDRMGDLLMSLPALHEIRASFPEAHLTLLLQKGLEPLLEGHPDVDRLLVWEPAKGQGLGAIWGWAGRLRRERFDAALVLNPTRLFHAASCLAGIPLRIGYRRKCGILLNRTVPDTKARRDLHEVEYNLELVRLLNSSSQTQCHPAPALYLPSRPETDREAEELLKGRGISADERPIAIHPWTSNPAKGWPLESFLEVARRLAKGGRPVLILGGSECRGLMDPVKPQMGSGPVDLVGRVPLKVLPALLRRCSVLISNDSGPVHVAAAVGTSTIVVAPESHARLMARWRPLGDGHRILLSPRVEDLVAAASP